MNIDYFNAMSNFWRIQSKEFLYVMVSCLNGYHVYIMQVVRMTRRM